MIRTVLTASLLALAAPAAAELYCVASVSQLHNAIGAARLSLSASEIRIVAGVYDLQSSTGVDDAAITIRDDTGLTITGGYAPGCAGGLPDSQPQATILRPPFGERLMDILVGAGDPEITIRQLSFRRGRSLSNNAACLGVQIPAQVTGRVNLLHNEFTDCIGPAAGCAVSVNLHTASLNLSNSLIHNNECGAGALTLVAGPNAVLQATHNTIVYNRTTFATPGAIAGMQVGRLSGSNLVYLINNVIYFNGDADDLDLRFNTDIAGFARSNVIGRRNDFPPSMVLSNNSAANPQFFSSTYYAPTANSPLVNAGHTTAPFGLPTKDFDSVARPQGGVYDIGAYELPQEGFRNGFE